MADIQGIQKRFSTWAADEFRPAVLATSVLSGLLLYLLEILFVISFAALIFSGPLARHLPLALGFIILGDAILIAAIAMLSSYPGSVGVAQDTPGAILGVVAAAIVAALPAAVAQQFATVVMMLVITTMMTGALFLTLGIFKLGGLARFLPYPVMGGFLAGTGWLLVKGGVGIMVSVPFGPEWFGPQALAHWLPGAILGVILYVSVTRSRRSLTLPVVLALGAVLFYIVAGALNVSLSTLEAEGWLVGTVPAGSLSNFPLSPEFLSQVNWAVLLGQLPNLVPVALISVIALLLNSSGMELVIKKDIDLNRELVAAGVGNLVAGVLSGLVGYSAISLSTLNHRVSGGKRLVGMIAALLVGLTIFLGASLLMVIPKMILWAVLVYLGVALLVEWVYQAWFKFPKIDFAIIVSILAVIMLSGFLAGIIVGLVLAIILFVVNYSQVSIVKFALSADEYHSRVTRSSQLQQILEARGDQLYIFKLQGFIFFGTANGIFDQVRDRIQSNPARPPRFVLLDFTQVSGLDSTGVLSFTRMLQWSQEQKLGLVLTGLRGRVQAQFARGGFYEQPGSLRFFPDLDHGIEWCETEILAGALTGESIPADLMAELGTLVGGPGGVEKLLAYMHRQEYAAGEYLIRQGDEPEMIYFVESGQVTAQLEVPGQAAVRLETMRGGRSVGELGFYLGIKRTAAVIVDEPGVIYSLSRQELAQIEKTDPEVANLFHRINLQLLGERTVHLIHTVSALER